MRTPVTLRTAVGVGLAAVMVRCHGGDAAPAALDSAGTEARPSTAYAPRETSVNASDWRSNQPALPDPVRWTMYKDGGRVAECRIVRHPLGFQLRLDVDGAPRLTHVHRQEADADIHAAALEDRFIEKGWS
jgi:hypothetical protein